MVQKRPIVLDLSGEWAFTYTPTRKERAPTLNAFTATMPVPGCWDDKYDQAKAKALWPDAKFNPAYRPIRYPMEGKPPDASLPYLLGTGWYLRRLNIPADWKSSQITLHVSRVVMEAWVYVNGQEVHHHLGHSTNWEADLTPYLKYGETNDVVIAVDNTRSDRSGCVIRGWKGRSAGIFGPIWLHVAGEARISDVYVYPREGKLHWRVELQGNLPKDAQLRWQIEGVTSGVKAVDGTKVEWTSEPKGMKPWSDRDPKLYQIEVGLWSGDRRLDVRKQPFGLRQLTTHGFGLRLNGQPIFLRGVCDSAYFPETCTLPTNVEWYRRHLRRLKQIGFNWIRCHTWVPLEPYLQAADEEGMLIQVESPVGYKMPEWQDILRACRKHPSVVIYCCGNEEMLNEEKIEFLRQCAAELRTSVPDALFNPQSALRGVEYGWAKTDPPPPALKPFPHDPKRLAALKEFSDVFSQFAWGWLSYTSLQGEPEKIDERLAIYERPCLTHELGICGCYLDLSLEERYRNTRIGPALYAGVREALRQAGLLKRAPVYYRNSAAWQRLIMKDAMETARLCRRLAGYDCLGANDTHWHRTGYSCGLLNEFDELKPGRTVDDILNWNGESVLLISQKLERCLQAGQHLKRDVFLSWFGEGELRNAKLLCELRGADKSLIASVEEMVKPIQAGTVEQIASLNLATPALDQPMKATLSAELFTPCGVIRNQWDFWLFPPVRADFTKGVQVVSTLDESSLRALAEGGRVVLLGYKPLPSRAMSFQMGLAGRPAGNLATVIARHPLMDGFPHDGYCDWQFFKMLNGANPIQFDMFSDLFEPILEVVSSYKHIRKQSVLFEWRVGSGRLLVCALNLQKDDPAAAWLRYQIFQYASSDKFQPSTSVSVERVAQLCREGSHPATPSADSRTDHAFDERGQVPKKK